MPAESDSYMLCQAHSVLYGHAPLSAGPDSFARWQGKASSSAPFPTSQWRVEISFMEQARFSFYGLFRLPVDEETLYQLQDS